MVVEIIQREISAKGIGYVILRDCPEDRLGEALGRGMEKLKKAGAQRVLATSLPEGEPLYAGPVGVWRLTPVYKIIRMERALPAPRPDLRLNLRSPKKASEDAQWLELVNRAFQAVPGSRTRDASSMRLQNHRCAVAYGADGKAIGAYELDLSEKVPELVTLAVEPELWRQGYGRSILRAALDSLGPKATLCALTVSDANLPAMALYEAEGWNRTGVVSEWFEVV